MNPTNSINPQISERVAIVETKVDAMITCIDEIKTDVRDMHDCLDKTRDEVMAELKNMNQMSTDQHNELSSKVGDLEKFKTDFLLVSSHYTENNQLIIRVYSKTQPDETFHKAIPNLEDVYFITLNHSGK